MFCRFLEFYLVSVNIPDCAIGIIATNIRGAKSDQREWGTWLCVRDRRTSYSEGTAVELRLDTRLKKARKSRHYRIDLEGLEARTLLATTPAAARHDD